MVLRNADLIFRCSANGASTKASGFLLSLLSLVWRAKVCGGFSQGSKAHLQLEETEADAFGKLLDMGCGLPVSVVGLRGLIELGRVADRYRLEEVCCEIEAAAIRHLTLETCGEMMMVVDGSGLTRLENETRQLALKEFEAFAGTSGFMSVGEEMLNSLLEDDGLRATSEERVFEAVVRWMKDGESGRVRGEGLLRKIRFPLMSEDYLFIKAREALDAIESLEGLVLESVGLLSISPEQRGQARLRYLEPKSLQPRKGKDVMWGQYATEGRAARRISLGSDAWSLAVHRDVVCVGCEDGSVAMLNKSSLEIQHTLTGHTAVVRVLAVSDLWVISGSDDHQMRVWNAASGECEGVLTGHTDSVYALAVNGDRLLSGSRDHSIKVWLMSDTPSSWECERTCLGHTDSVLAVHSWGDSAASGSFDKTVRVWEISTGLCKMTLRGHDGAVDVVLPRGTCLISASRDKTVKVWSLETRECLQTVQVYPAESTQFVQRLAVSGSKLVGGSHSYYLSATEEYELHVWNLETLELEHTLKQPVGKRVTSLAVDSDEVWGAVGNEVVLWGRKA